MKTTSTLLAALTAIGLFASAPLSGADATAPKLSFSFAPGKPAAGVTPILPATAYTAAQGYGFEPGAVPVVVGDNALGADTSFFFSVAVPEGNYRVTVTFGSAKAASDNTVKAELRRLMLEKIHTDAGQSVTRSFIVNVRRPQFPGGQVSLNARERGNEARAWDDKLTLEFAHDAARSAVSAVTIEKVDVPTVFLLGDSTVCDQPVEPFNSWGQMITRWFKPEIAVANHSESGESVAPSLGAHRFDKIWSQMKPGDYLFVQFGHNDMKNKAANALDTYTANLRKVVALTRAKGGIPVLVTSVSRETFGASGKITDSFNGYTDAVRKVAREEKAALVDLQNSSAKFYEALGKNVAQGAFANDKEKTHHNNYGSYEVAKCVLMGIKEAKLDLAQYISADFTDFDPSQPDPIATFKMAKGSERTAETPLGN